MCIFVNTKLLLLLYAVANTDNYSWLLVVDNTFDILKRKEKKKSYIEGQTKISFGDYSIIHAST